MPYFLFYFSTSKCYINFMHVSLGIKIEFSNFWLFSKKYLFHKKKKLAFLKYPYPSYILIERKNIQKF